MATPFEEFVNRELPRRAALLTLALTGWDDNPSLPGAPAILQGAPLGTWFHEDTSDVFWRRYKSGWQIVGGGGGGGSEIVTTTDMVIPIDFNDAGAVDPPGGALLTSQDVVDDILTSLGATNFKYVDRVYRALPALVATDVTLQLAAGVHRPSDDPENTASWSLNTKEVIAGGNLRVIGALSSEYTPIVGTFAAPLTVDSYGAGTNNPYLSFTGTPFVGLNLKGRYAITGAGQVIVINDNDDSTLYVNDNISPVPGTCFVGKPSTIFRNSLDDISNLNSSVMQFGSSPFSGYVYLEDVSVQCFGGNGIILSLSGAARLFLRRTCIDDQTQYDDFGKAPNGRPLQISSTITTIYGIGVSYTAPSGVAGNDQLTWSSGGNNSQMFIMGSYFGENTGVLLQDFAVTFRSTVFEKVTGYWFKVVRCQLTFQHITGKINEIRGSRVNLVNSELPPVQVFASSAYTGVQFKDCLDDDCLRVEGHSYLDLTPTPSAGFLDGGGNVGVGFALVGPNAVLILNAPTTLSGALGDVKMADGSIWSYSDIATYGPIVDEYGNRVRK